MQEYADPVIDWLDAGRGILARRFFREVRARAVPSSSHSIQVLAPQSCTQLPNGSYSKDLTLVEADLSRIAILDNSPVSYSTCQGQRTPPPLSSPSYPIISFPANGIPVEGWTSDPSDEALLDLLPFLDSLRFASDVRSILGIRGF